MLDIKDINNLDVDILLSSYEGKNPYMRYMKKKMVTEKNYFLTNSQSNYIKSYYYFEPKVINKVIELTDYFSEQLQEEHKLNILPKILVIFCKPTKCNWRSK